MGNAAQLQRMKGFAPVDNGWAGVTHTEGRVVSTLQYIETVPNPLTRGGAIELQRHGLSLAISNAHHDGRLSLSQGSIQTYNFRAVSTDDRAEGGEAINDHGVWTGIFLFLG